MNVKNNTALAELLGTEHVFDETVHPRLTAMFRRLVFMLRVETLKAIEAERLKEDMKYADNLRREVNALRWALRVLSRPEVAPYAYDEVTRS